MKPEVSVKLMKSTKAFLLAALLIMAPVIVGTVQNAYAEKIYTKEQADLLCEVSFMQVVEGLGTMAKAGATSQQLKDAIKTNDPEIKKLLFIFIDQVMGGNPEAAKTAELILSTCSKKLQELDV
jgi:hypothetical protein